MRDRINFNFLLVGLLNLVSILLTPFPLNPLLFTPFSPLPPLIGGERRGGEGKTILRNGRGGGGQKPPQRS